MEERDGVLSGWCWASWGGVPAWPPASGKEPFPPPLARELQSELLQPRWRCRDRTEPQSPSLPAGMLSPADPQPQQSSWAWLSWQLPRQLPCCSLLGSSLQPSRYSAEAFAPTVRAISGSQNQYLQAAKPHRTVFNRNFIDIEDPRRTLMNTWTLVWHLSA